jgi:ArsR family transcriptional regulator
MKDKGKEIDDVLFVLDNPLRRRILALLAREDHYPLQLAKVLKVSQQSILKHLKMLEEHGFVKVREVKSDLGGPNRKLYSASKHFSVTIDLGLCSLDTEIHPIDEEEGAKPTTIEPFKKDIESLRSASNYEEMRQRYASTVSKIDSELEELEQRRQELVQLKDRILREALDNLAVEGDYMDRWVLFQMFSDADATLSDISELLDLREEIVRSILHKHFGSRF